MARRKSLFAAANEANEVPSQVPKPAERRLAPVAKKSPLEERNDVFADVAPTRRVPATIQLVTPEKCRMWRRHNRRYDLLTPENCTDLIERIAAKGQVIPAIVRRLPVPEGEAEFEVIAGARRHFAVTYLREKKGRADLLYKVEVRKLSDEEAFELSDLENRDRQDLSEYERAVDYASALEEFYEGNQSKMAEKIKMSRSTLINYIQLAKLPNAVLDAYGDPRRISVRHGKALMAELNGVGAGHLLERAGSLAEEQKRGFDLGGVYPLDGAKVFKSLAEAAAKRQKTAGAQKRKIKLGKLGEGLVKVGRKNLTIEIPRSADTDIEAILRKVARALEA